MEPTRSLCSYSSPANARLFGLGRNDGDFVMVMMMMQIMISGAQSQRVVGATCWPIASFAQANR